MSNTTCNKPENWRRTSLPHMSFLMKNWRWSTSPWLPACYWIEAKSKRWDIHIHYQLCGHGGERIIAGHPMDGYHHERRTVFQFHGCHFHGCPECFPERGHFFSRKREKTWPGRTCTKERFEETKSDCPSRVQPDCEVGAREAYSNAQPTCPQEKPDVSTRHCVRLWVVSRPQNKGVAHKLFGFQELARPCLGLSGQHIRSRTGAHLRQRPERAAEAVLGSAAERRRRFERVGETGIHNTTFWAAGESAEGNYPRLVWPNPGAGF